jgi:protein-arginine kinase
MNTKREKFVKLANRRVRNSINQIRLIRNLSNSNFYDYTEDDVKKIIQALSEALELVKKDFGSKKENKEKEFELEV